MTPDFASDVNSQRSTTSYIFTLGSGAVRWVSRLRKIISLSTKEVEYITVTRTYKELIWPKNFMKELGKEQVSPSLHSDSHSAIHLAKNLVYHDKTKHIDVWNHFIHILLKDGVLSLKKIHTSQSLVNILTMVV